MERKIGEIFEYKGEWYQCIEGRCRDCYFSEKRFLCKQFITKDFCTSGIIFKRLEKVGGLYEFQKRTIQTYKLYTEPFISFDMDFINTYLNGSDTIDIIIKQNIEDMEENKLNLKPFDLEAAKVGKPVCTRNGRKARIICFDLKNDEYPIVAAVEDDSTETLFSYTTNGEIADGIESDKDLMMLPEKKEGWVNVYREESNNNERLIEQTIYKTRKDAFDNACPKGYITTTKINWEE